jgi:hypothetical protein
LNRRFVSAAWLRYQLMCQLILGMLRMGIPMAVEALGALRTIEFVPLTGCETEDN